MSEYGLKTVVATPQSKMVDQVLTNHESLDKWCFLLLLFLFVCFNVDKNPSVFGREV